MPSQAIELCATPIQELEGSSNMIGKFGLSKVREASIENAPGHQCGLWYRLPTLLVEKYPSR
ncbi:hypothetical protein J6590_099648 [Homalodisca vitripennis]|nr:hypothetical protein J6590_099648 [Homalodisca vitripennis]